MPPRSATRRALGRRKKPTSATAGESEAAAVDNLESPASGGKTEDELADAVVVKDGEEKEDEELVHVEVANPDSAETDGDLSKDGVSVSAELMIKDNLDSVEVDGDSTKNSVSVSTESMIKEELVVENSEVDRVNVVGNSENGEAHGEIEKEKGNEDVVSGSEQVKEGEGVGAGKNEDEALQQEKVADVSQEETAAVEVDDLMVLNDIGTPQVVKDDGDGGEKSAEIISVEASESKGHCVDGTALVVKDGGNEDRKDAAETKLAQVDSTKSPCENNGTLADSAKVPCENNTVLVDSTKTPCENNTALADTTKAPCDNNAAVVVNDDFMESADEEESDNGSEGDDEDSEGDEHPSLSVQDSLTDKKKDKDIEIYVGRLDKKTVEDDLINVFQKFGELKSTRIVRNPTTNKSKGFAFIRFASVQQAKHALSELKDGVEVRGKHVKISASQDNDTLYLGNICKTWKKEEVLQQLEHYGIKHIEEIKLPDDPKNEGKIKGFAFLEFSTHSDAMTAFQRLRKPDAVFGRDISAKVAFTHTPLHPGDEVLSQVKRVYVEGLTKDWNEEKVKDACKQYGEVVKIDLCLKQKDFGFVTFTSHESALACVEGINNAGLGGDVKIKASLAKPQYKSRLQKQGFRGGFKVEKQSEPSLKKEGVSSKEAESSKVKGDSNSRQAKRKREAASKNKIKASNAKPQRKGQLQKQGSHGGLRVEKQIEVPQSKKEGESSKEAESSKIKGDLSSQQAKGKRKASFEQKSNAPPELGDGGQGSSKKSKKGPEGQNIKTNSKPGNLKRKKASKNEGREGGGIRGVRNKKPFKKQKGNMQGRERENARNPRRETHIRKGRDDYRGSTRHKEDPYAPKYAASSAYHQGSSSMSASARRYAEMEPHAGYIAPAPARQGRSSSGYVQPVVRTHSQHHTIYVEPPPGNQSQLHPRYVDRAVVTQSHRGYIEVPVGAQVQSYAAHRQPAVVQLAHDPYSPGLARAVRHDGRGTNGPAYIGGRQLSASQVPNRTSYASYQVMQPSSNYVQSSGAYGAHRSYY